MGTQYFEVLVFLPRGPPEIDPRLLDQIQGPEIYSRHPGRRGTSVFLTESDYSASDPGCLYGCLLMQIW